MQLSCASLEISTLRLYSKCWQDDILTIEQIINIPQKMVYILKQPLEGRVPQLYTSQTGLRALPPLYV